MGNGAVRGRTIGATATTASTSGNAARSSVSASKQTAPPMEWQASHWTEASAATVRKSST